MVDVRVVVIVPVDLLLLLTARSSASTVHFLSAIRATRPCLCHLCVPGKMFQCGMLERDKRALRKRSTVLCKQLVVDELFIQCLQANETLTDIMAEDILVCTYLHTLLTAHSTDD